MKHIQKGIKPVKSFYYKSRYFFGKSLIFLIESILSLFIQKGVFFSKDDFEWTQEFSKNYLLIKKEFEKIQQDNRLLFDVTELSEEQNKVVKLDFWHFIPLYFYGFKIEKYCQKAPQTSMLLEKIPYMTTAIFSTLKPGAKIESHRGAYRGFLRFHLGVDIPDDYKNCKIFFNEGDPSYSWKNGECVIFDDTYTHFVKNNTSSDRTVLYVDFIRPMPGFLRRISFLLLRSIQNSPYVQNVLVKLKQFDNNHRFGKIKYSF